MKLWKSSFNGPWPIGKFLHLCLALLLLHAWCRVTKSSTESVAPTDHKIWSQTNFKPQSTQCTLFSIVSHSSLTKSLEYWSCEADIYIQGAREEPSPEESKTKLTLTFVKASGWPQIPITFVLTFPSCLVTNSYWGYNIWYLMASIVLFSAASWGILITQYLLLLAI